MALAVRKEMPGLFWAIVVLVVLSPLPLGAVYTWSWAAMGAVVGVVLLIWAVRVAFGLRERGIGLRSIWPVAGLFLLVVVWVGVQLLPFTPADWHHPLWSSASTALGAANLDAAAPGAANHNVAAPGAASESPADLAAAVGGAISLNPFEGASGLLRLLTYAGIFWISLQYCRRPARARQVVLAVVCAGLVYALYGLIVYAIGSDTILIFRKSAYLGDVTSTFVNRNSYATYAGLGLISATGLVIAMFTQGAAAGETMRTRTMRMVEVAAERGWPLLLAWSALLLALVLAHSRAGFLSTLVGLLTLIVAAGLTRAVDRRFAIGFGVVCLLVLVWIVSLGGEELLFRFVQTSLANEERPLVYQRTLDAIRDAGAFGTGLGSFEEAFRFYRTSDIHGYFNMAHDTYLENMLELGLPAALALFGTFAGFIYLCLIGIVARRRDAVYPCVGFAATVLVAVHSIVDFSLQIPAVTATYMLLMGAACAQSWSSRRAADPW